VHPTSVAAPSVDVNDVNLNSQFEIAEGLLKKGKPDDALRLFQAVYNYARDTLALLKTVKGAYEKALSGAAIDQAKKEDLFLKLERVSSLSVRYTDIKSEAAYHLGEIYKAKSNSEQARKYLLEACQTASFSLDPSSTWMKAKNLLLVLSNLEGEF
jgi:tetratricopeptide (TPR) repeat protein